MTVEHFGHLNSIGYKQPPHEIGGDVIEPAGQVVTYEMDPLTRSRIGVRPDAIVAALRALGSSDVTFDPFIGLRSSSRSTDLRGLLAVLDAEAYVVEVEQALLSTANDVDRAVQELRANLEERGRVQIERSAAWRRRLAENVRHVRTQLGSLPVDDAEPGTVSNAMLLRRQYEMDLVAASDKAAIVDLDEVLTATDQQITVFASGAASGLAVISARRIIKLRRERRARHARRGIVFGLAAVFSILLGSAIDSIVPVTSSIAITLSVAVFLFGVDVVVDKALLRRRRRLQFDDLIAEVVGAASVVRDAVAREEHLNGMLHSAGLATVRVLPRTLLGPL